MPGHSDLYYQTGISCLLAPANHTAPAQSAAFDLQNFDSAVIGFNIGTPGDTLSTNTKICLEVQESADGVTWTACADSALTNVTDTNAVNTGTAAVLTANAQGGTVYFTGYIGFQRYVRGVLNYVGTHSVGTIADVFGLAGRPRLGKVNP